MTPRNTTKRTPPDIEAQLQAIEDGEGEGEVDFGGGRALRVTSLGKIFFPKAGITKGDMMRYYTRVSRFLLPDIEDRPLVLKRLPDGVGGQVFYQQDAGANVPDDVHVASVDTVEKGKQDRIIGGDLLTLLYTVQLGAIEVHPWFSTVKAPESPDRSLIDLDPGEGVPFARVVALAQHIVRTARECELTVALKTSGSRGIHIVFPLPARTSFDTSQELASQLARLAAATHPDLATVERSISARPAGTIYVDALQNAHGKSMASAWSIRAKDDATVSTPIRPRELTPKLKLSSYTVKTVPQRAERLGDIWREAMSDRPTARTLARAMAALEQAQDAAKPPRAPRPRRRSA